MKSNQINILVFLFAAAFNAAGQPAKIDDSVLVTLSKFRSDYSKGITDHNPMLFAAYYSDNIRLMPEFQKTVIGKPNVLIYHHAFSSRFKTRTYSRNKTEIVRLGQQILETGMFETSVTSPAGNAYSVIGKYFSIWEQSSSGLLLICDAWNYNQSLEFEAELKFTDVPVSDVAAQQHLPVDNPIRFELAALNRLMETTVTQHDAKIWAQFYTDDGAFFYSRQPASVGKKALSEFFAEHVKGLPIFEKLDVRNDRVDNLGTYVVEYASHIAIIRSGDFSGVFTGKDLVVWRREPDCSLKIFRHIAMYD